MRSPTSELREISTFSHFQRFEQAPERYEIRYRNARTTADISAVVFGGGRERERERELRIEAGEAGDERERERERKRREGGFNREELTRVRTVTRGLRLVW